MNALVLSFRYLLLFVFVKYLVYLLLSFMFYVLERPI